jgi:hypothetical protein
MFDQLKFLIFNQRIKKMTTTEGNWIINWFDETLKNNWIITTPQVTQINK